MRPGRAGDHSPPSIAVVMEEESYTSTHPLGHTGPVTGSLYLFIYSKYIVLYSCIIKDHFRPFSLESNTSEVYKYLTIFLMHVVFCTNLETSSQ